MGSDNHDTWSLDVVEGAEFARRVYARSWPVTARGDYTSDEIIERIGARDAAWWQRKLAKSHVKIAGGPALGGFGFAFAERDEDHWDLSYLFLEPEAFGTGLAGILHDQVLALLAGQTAKVGGWVLEHNIRSQRFLAARGWQSLGVQTPPWAESNARFIRFELALPEQP